MISRLPQGLSTCWLRFTSDVTVTHAKLASGWRAPPLPRGPSNPLGHIERLQITFFLLSRTCPDASWVHMRRNFFELATAGPASIASEALKHIAAFYAIEKEIRGRSAEERRLLRQQKSRPLADAFKVWLRGKLALISQKIKLAEAIRYSLSRWKGLTRFIDDAPFNSTTIPSNDQSAVSSSVARTRCLRP